MLYTLFIWIIHIFYQYKSEIVLQSLNFRKVHMPDALREAIGKIGEAYFGLGNKPVYVVWRTPEGPKAREFWSHELHVEITREGPVFYEALTGTDSKLVDISYIASLDDYEGVKNGVDLFWTYDVDVARHVFVIEREALRGNSEG